MNLGYGIRGHFPRRRLFQWLLLPAALGLGALNAQEAWEYSLIDGQASASLDAAIFGDLQAGDEFALGIAEGVNYQAHIDRRLTLDNGDLSWQGTFTDALPGYGWAITVGRNTAHASIYSPEGEFQFFGIRNELGFFEGSLRRAETAPAQDDVIISPPSAGLTPDLLQRNLGALANTEDGDCFSLTQEVENRYELVGSRLTFSLNLQKTCPEAVQEVQAYIWYVLENTRLASSPENCSRFYRSLPDHKNGVPVPYLRCSLGNFDAAEQEKNFSITVETEEDSHPLVYSVVVITSATNGREVGNGMSVYMLWDVVTDSDEDGISDFNENLLGSNPQDGLELPVDTTEIIDVLAVYPQVVQEGYYGEAETRINHLFSEANRIFADSDTGIILRPVAFLELDYMPDANSMREDLKHLYDDDNEGPFARARAARRLLGADLVALFRFQGTDDIDELCGLANGNGYGRLGDFSAAWIKNYANSAIGLECGDRTLAHEVGHNMGLHHSRRQEPDGGTFLWSVGYGVDQQFVTVMAYWDAFDTYSRIPRFSNPQRICNGFYYCGVDEIDPVNGANAVASLKLVKHQVSRFYSPLESRLLHLDAVSTRETATSAIIQAGAYQSGAGEFSSAFPADALLNVKVMFTAPAEHIGESYVTHWVLRNAEGRFLQPNDNGDLSEWSGRVADLTQSPETRVMRPKEHFDMISELNLASLDLTGQSFKVYVAYQILENSELVYGSKPLDISVAGSDAIHGGE